MDKYHFATRTPSMLSCLGMQLSDYGHVPPLLTNHYVGSCLNNSSKYHACAAQGTLAQTTAARRWITALARVLDKGPGICSVRLP